MRAWTPPVAMLAWLVTLLAGCELTGPSVKIFNGPTDSVFVFPPVDFNADGEHPVEPAPPEILVDGLAVRAHVEALDTEPDDPPMRVRMEVTIRNPADTAVTVRLDGCPLRPLAFPTRARREAVLRQEPGTLQCVEPPTETVLEPRVSLSPSFEIPAVSLGAMGPDGRYYFSAVLGLEGSGDTIPAGSADVQLQRDGLAYAVALEREGDGMWAAIEISNDGADPVYLEYGACTLELALYRDAARAGPTVPWRAQEDCALYLAMATIDPGEVLRAPEFTRSFDSDRLPELAPGVYLVEVQLTLNRRRLRFPMGTLVIG